ncbi:hypothetical protein ACFY2M_39550 [Streptomyces sp. NPDC001276]|uniref:hypothetical protein n=1 Tax=Streptomyces sp. NPDC001276 TaxID=3364555 RepID=UPI0036B65348
MAGSTAVSKVFTGPEGAAAATVASRRTVRTGRGFDFAFWPPPFFRAASVAA